jgi:hypothetical protein
MQRETPAQPTPRWMNESCSEPVKCSGPRP